MASTNLRIQIERLRRGLRLLASEKGLSHPEVLKASRLLDQKLNKYNRLVIKN